MASLKEPITMRAVIQRVNRKLAEDGRQLRASRGKESGFFYVLDLKKHVVVERRVDAEKFGRKLGVVKEWETVEGQS